MSYVSLHTHSEHSALDSTAKVKALFAATKDMGQTALAITDHGNADGLWKAQAAADANCVKLIPGIEAYLAIGNRFERNSLEVDAEFTDDSDDSADDVLLDEEGEPLPAVAQKKKTKKYEHLTLLATSPVGWKNMVRIINASQETKWGKYPRIDYKLVAAHSEDIIILSGCLGGPILGPLARGDLAEAERNLLTMIHTVGRDNVYLEVMEHGIEAETRILNLVAWLGAEYGVKLVATNDSHHVHANGHDIHDAWLAVSTKAKLADEKRYRFNGTGFHHRSEAEMLELRPEGWWAEAVQNTTLVADRVAARCLPVPAPKLPSFPTPVPFANNRAYYQYLVTKGAVERYGDLSLRPDVRARLNVEAQVILHPSEELALIYPDGFVDYFLIYHQIIAWCLDKGILVGPGRGSAAGSITAYCLRITGICPLENDLLFERFFEKGRPDFPDIDVDFEALERGGILDFMESIWGKKSVSLIGSFSSAKTKRAIKDAARVLDAGRLGDVLSKLVPVEGGNPFSFEQLFDTTVAQSAEFRAQYAKSGEQAERVVELARGFVNTVNGSSIHACGVIVSDLDLTDLIPQRIDNKTGRRISAWDSKDVEKFGLLKIDVLSLRNLDVAKTCIGYIFDTTGERIDFYNLPHPNTQGDPRVDAAYKLIQDGRTAGIFQMESPAMSALGRQVQPKTLTDISAVVALFRPGPLSAGMDQHFANRKNGKEAIDYTMYTTDPVESGWLETVLGDTYGTCLVGGSRVYSVTRGKLVDIADITVGELVQSHTDTGETVARHVLAWQETGVKPVIQTRFTNGAILRSTADHKVLTTRGWVAIGSLLPEDSVASPWAYLPPTEETTQTNARARILGLLLGDGYLGHSSAVNFVSKGAELHNSFRTAALEAFPGTNFSYFERARGVGTTNVTGGGPRGGVSGTPEGTGASAGAMLTWLRELGLKAPRDSWRDGGSTSQNKFVPAEYLSGDTETVVALLGALWDTDGTITFRKAPRGQGAAIAYKTISPQLAEDVQFLLSRLSIPSTLTRSTYVAARGPRTAFTITVTDEFLFACTFANALHNTQKTAVAQELSEREFNQFARAISRGSLVSSALVKDAVRATGKPIKPGFRSVGVSPNIMSTGVSPFTKSSSVALLGEAFDSDELRALSAVRWVQVREQVALGDERVFDITVEDTHNFVADGIVVHNCVFQESMMRLGTVVAGFDAAERGALRRAVSKKDPVQMALVGEKFRSQAGTEYKDENGEVISPVFAAATADRVWEMLKGGASYLFNASHSAAYAQLAYITAYLKANWPAAYGAAILAVTDSEDKRILALRALPEEGIEILGPDVNLSRAHSFPENTTQVRLGLAEIKGVGVSGELIEQVRVAGGPDYRFTSFHSVIDEVRKGGVNAEGETDLGYLPTNHVDALIEAGAFDTFGPRMGLFTVGRIIKDAAHLPVPDLEWGYLERSARQRGRLLISLGEHPLTRLQNDVRNWNKPGPINAMTGEVFRSPGIPVASIPDEHGTTVTAIGVLARFKEKAYRGGRMASLTLEGSNTSINGVLWDKTLTESKLGNVIPPLGGLVAATCRVTIREFENEDEEGNTVVTQEKSLTVERLYAVPVVDPAHGALVATLPRVDFLSRPAVVAAPVAVEAPALWSAADLFDDDAAGPTDDFIWPTDDAAPPAYDAPPEDAPVAAAPSTVQRVTCPIGKARSWAATNLGLNDEASRQLRGSHIFPSKWSRHVSAVGTEYQVFSSTVGGKVIARITLV